MSDNWKGKIAIVGGGSLINEFILSRISELADDAQIVTVDEARKLYAPEPMKIKTPPIAYLEPEYVPHTKKSVHHNSKQRPGKRKKPGKKTHRK